MAFTSSPASASNPAALPILHSYPARRHKHRPQPGSLESQGSPALPSWVHGRDNVLIARGHAMLGHALVSAQLTSHAHDPAQSTDGQAPAPAQRTEHARAPQVRPPHDAAPEQSTSQLPVVQSSLPHAPWLEQRIVQA